MADVRIRSPNPRQRIPFSPTKSPRFIRSNDDSLERSQARAARAAAMRRKSLAPDTSAMPRDDLCLGKEQVLELFHNCIKLASENKINQKNTWELNLIDHLCEIIKVEEENDDETNFQKASCTLEAGVKIYSMRVDSTHSEVYKVLGGINRVGQEPEEDHVTVDENKRAEHAENGEMRDHGKKLSPLSTLESSFAALNVKKFDAAFVVDPLYHQTSAQFDEGGARGLLLNNLGVYDNCRVLFDSKEIPGMHSSPVPQFELAETVDLSFAAGCIQEMVMKMFNTIDITPSLRVINEQFGDHHGTHSESLNSAESVLWQGNDKTDIEVDFISDAPGNPGSWELDHDDHLSVLEDGNCTHNGEIPSHQHAPELHFCRDPGEEDRLEEVDQYLLVSLGFSTKQNAWAGPNHWKYRKISDSAAQFKENTLPKEKKTKIKKTEKEINFSSSINNDYSHLFLAPKNSKSLLLPSNRAPSNKKLPEDCHYQPEDLMKLFLLPHVLCFGNKGRKRTDVQDYPHDEYGQNVPWDDDENSAFDDEYAHHDHLVDTSMLVKQPRQTSKTEVQYDKTSKIVDVHSLKETIWENMIQSSQTSAEETCRDESPENCSVSFKQVLANFPNTCKAAASLEDISPHLCFICLLHLANEHELRILGCPSLDELTVHLKPQN